MTTTKRRYSHPLVTQRQISASGHMDTLSVALLRLHLLNRGLSLHQLIILVTVSLHPGVTSKALQRQTGLSLASVSRNTNALASLTRTGDRGLGLIEMRPDPTEARRYNFHLTKQGLSVAQDMVGVLGGNK